MALKRLFGLSLLLFFALQVLAAKWIPAKVVNSQGDTLVGEIKVGRTSYSDFLKFRDDKGYKTLLYPQDYPEVLTLDNHFIAIWFDDDVAGYNTYRYGKVLTLGEIEVYDVFYPYRSCACKTQGTRKHHWVIKIADNSLFIVEHNWFTGEIQNRVKLFLFLLKNSDIASSELQPVFKREQLLKTLISYNKTFGEFNRTYSSDAFEGKK